jgi:hypothetical protein
LIDEAEGNRHIVNDPESSDECGLCSRVHASDVGS